MKKENNEFQNILITNKTKFQKSNQWRKIIKISSLTIVSAGLITAIVLPLFSSNSSSIKNNISFIANRNLVQDGSFNEATFNGVTSYDADFRTNPLAGSIQSKTETITPTFGFDDGQKSGFYPYFDTAINRGSRVVVSAAFNTVATATKYAKENPLVKFIVLDDNVIPYSVSNSIAVDFRSQEAGFFAGVVASLYATFKSKTEITNYSSIIGTWGGEILPNVWPWLSGYEQGMNWYNYAILGYNNVVGNNSVLVEVDNFLDLIRTDVSTKINGNIVFGTGSLQYAANSTNNQKFNSLNLKARGVGTAFENASQIRLSSGTYTTTPQFYQDYQTYIDDTSYKSNDWYSLSFDTPDENAALMADKLFDLKVPATFPVAANQFLYTLNKNMYTIGVDSDVYKSLMKEDANSQTAKYVLASATKNLETSAKVTLWASDRFSFGFQNEKKSIGTKVINGDVEYIWTHEDENMYNLLKTDISQEVDLIDENENVIDTTYGWATDSSHLAGNQLQGTSLNGGSSLVYSDTANNSLLVDGYDWFLNSTQSLNINNMPQNPKEFVEASLAANSYTSTINGIEWNQAGSGPIKIVAAESHSPTFIIRQTSPYFPIVPAILYSDIFPSWIPEFTLTFI